jgi:hypothetical protein
LLALFEGTFASRLSEQTVFEDLLLRLCHRFLINFVINSIIKARAWHAFADFHFCFNNKILPAPETQNVIQKACHGGCGAAGAMMCVVWDTLAPSKISTGALAHPSRRKFF